MGAWARSTALVTEANLSPAVRGGCVLRHYQLLLDADSSRRAGSLGEFLGDGDAAETCAILESLLTDLRHFALRAGIDFSVVDSQASARFVREHVLGR